MRSFFICAWLLINSVCLGQYMNDIDKELCIPDSLEQHEIRIYKSFSSTNSTEIFRMFLNENEKWKVEFYAHSAAIPGTIELAVQKKKLKKHKDLEGLWLEIIQTNIVELPDLKEINWKLRKPKIEEIHGRKTIGWREKHVLDGESYDVEISWGSNENKVRYSNHKAYLNDFPDVDELLLFDELIKLIQREFEVFIE